MKPVDRMMSFAGPCQSLAIRHQPGQPGMPRLLCVHGWLDNLESFTPLLRHLNDYEVVSFDLPGHGLSSHIDGSQLTYDFWQGPLAVEYLRAALGWERFTLVGHSLGGVVGTLYAAAWPSHLNGLITIDALGLLSETAEDAAKRWRRFAHLHKAIHPPKEIEVSFTRLMNARIAKTPMPFADCERILRRNTVPVQNESHENHDIVRFVSDPRLRIPTALRPTEEQVLSIIRSIEVPTHFLYGTHGFLQTSPWWHDRMKAWPHLTSNAIEGGHHTHLDNPEQCARHIQEFIGTLKISKG